MGIKVIGFNFTKITAEKSFDFKPGSSTNTNIEFLGVEKTKIDLLDDSSISEAAKVSFKYNVDHSENTKDKTNNQEKEEKTKKSKDSKKAKENSANITFEGFITLIADKEVMDSLHKSWKNKQILEAVRLPLFNLILNKCTLRALQLEEEVGLPLHLGMPKIVPQKPETVEKE